MKIYLTRNEAAKMMGVSPQSISNYITKGLIAAQSHGRHIFIDKESFEEFLSSYVGKGIKTNEDGLKALHSEVEALRAELTKERDSLQAQITLARETKKCNTILNAPMFYDFLKRLTEYNLVSREQEIVKQVARGTTLKELSESQNITRERVGQIFHRGLIKAIQAYGTAILRESRENELLARIQRQKEHIKQLQERVGLQETELEKMKYPQKSGKARRLMGINAVDYLVSKRASVRLLNCIRRMGDISLYSLTSIAEVDILKQRNLGKKALCELIDILSTDGLRLGTVYE